MSFGGKRIGGAAWTYMIYFDPDVDAPGDIHPISDDALIAELSKLVGVNEDIRHVYVHKTPLTDIQVTKVILCHWFVVFETDAWWWSIEKNSEGITLQRSQYIESVRDMYRQKYRKKYDEMGLVDEDEAFGTMTDLIEMLHDNDELNHRYDFKDSNCKHFSKVVFDHVARSKRLEHII